MFFWEKRLSLYIKESDKPAKACIIWMHGLGADASDMVGLVEQLPLPGIPVRHLFMDAPMRPVTLNGGMVMRAWYDIKGGELLDRLDREGIAQSEMQIRQTIDSQIEQGFTASQIFLAGFSQGGAMALQTALTSNMKLGGVVALSSYLPMGFETVGVLDKQTPFFIALGTRDPLVRPEWTKASAQWLQMNGYAQVDIFEYPMDHSICVDEIKDLSHWLIEQIQGRD